MVLDSSAAPAVTLGDLVVPLSEFLNHLQRRGRLQSLLREAVLEQFLMEQAKQAGLTITKDELQRAADVVRRREGLVSAKQTHAWLDRRGLSVTDFEDALERGLLIAKLKDHLSKDRISAHFEKHRSQYDRLRLRQITVPQEDLARELLSQIQDEGRDFAEVGQQWSERVVCLRRQLHPAIAAALPDRVGAVAGPVATPHGFTLVRVEEVRSAQFDPVTRATIRQELFEAWLRERLEQHPIRYPLLDELT